MPKQCPEISLDQIQQHYQHYQYISSVAEWHARRDRRLTSAAADI